MNDLEIDTLAPRARAALVAACAEHVLDIYRFGNFSLQVRHAPGKALSGPPEEDLLERALQIAWEYAEGGTLDDAVLDAVHEGLLAAPNDADREDLCMPGLTTLGMVGNVIRSLRDKTPFYASEVLAGGKNAVVDAVGALVNEEEAQRLGKQELALQREVFERATGGGPLSRKAFLDLVQRKLPWAKHLPAYREYYNG